MCGPFMGNFDACGSALAPAVCCIVRGTFGGAMCVIMIR